LKTIKRASILALGMSLAFAVQTFAHCDSMDGPVIADARRALAAGNVAPVLKWVPAQGEEEIRSAFAMAVTVRDQGEPAHHVADRYFFETLVRVHRAGEGEGFMGLKPAGSVEPVIAATDHGLAEGDIDHLADELAAAVRKGIQERFREAYERKKVADRSVAQGREYVEAYVQLTHFVERVHDLVEHGAGHRHPESK